MKLSLLQRLLSQILPIRVHSFPGKTCPELKLYRYRGRWQLEAHSALYSDGAAYTPLLKAFRRLKTEIAHARNMLVLGAGLGSAISVLEHLELPVPDTLMIDIDPAIIKLGQQLLAHPQVQWHCADVEQYVTENTALYDLLILDIFQDRVVPQFVQRTAFLEQCAKLLAPGGILIFNYIINDEADWNSLQERLQPIYTPIDIIPIQINRVLLLKKAAN